MLASDNQYSLPTRTAGGNTTLLQNLQILSLRSLKKYNEMKNVAQQMQASSIYFGIT